MPPARRARRGSVWVRVLIVLVALVTACAASCPVEALPAPPAAVSTGSSGEEQHESPGSEPRLPTRHPVALLAPRAAALPPRACAVARPAVPYAPAPAVCLRVLRSVVLRC